MYAMEHENS
ncbi:hypothetical protein BN170_1690003 [Clostridioides difficile T22]|nr:hypothetical protein BN170_1690003 [Clostridioides difficile T22]CCL18316.1 hypothetical protein BN171_2220003 [Clostridioides difficile E25]CCL22246.1 hypothetical protein BN172_3000003 [Clostridioides difficile T15]